MSRKPFSVLVRHGGWRCNNYKGRPLLEVGGRLFCPRCGRECMERFVARPGRIHPEYKRKHVGQFGFWGSC